jgi:hypothetical protein
MSDERRKAGAISRRLIAQHLADLNNWLTDRQTDRGQTWTLAIHEGHRGMARGGGQNFGWRERRKHGGDKREKKKR